jgi:hypothetical protein
MVAVATIVFYLPFASRSLSKARVRVRSNPLYIRVARGPVGRAVTCALSVFRPLIRAADRALVHAEHYARMNFYPGRRWFFATIGFEVFLVMMPLVLTTQKGLVDVSAFLFLAYAIFSYVNKIDDRVMIVSALLFLALCPFLLILNASDMAELSAIYAYYSLCTGVLLQFASYARNKDTYE